MERQFSRTDEILEKDKLMQLVGFNIGKAQFGVDILMVQEIIRIAPITSVPNSPDFIEGVINLRGSIIPVIDLRKRLNLQGTTNKSANTRILIVNVDERVTGFIVDAVSKVLKIQNDSIEPPPEIVVAGLKSKYIHGVCKIDESLLILLDFGRILQVHEIKKLKEFESPSVH
jgi:purine-binding chemotaxis protein CheW